VTDIQRIVTKTPKTCYCGNYVFLRWGPLILAEKSGVCEKNLKCRKMEAAMKKPPLSEGGKGEKVEQGLITLSVLYH
jgi:hypothetical protein